MAKLTIRQLASMVADESTRPRKVVEEILWATFNTLAKRLADGDSFVISNFGSLEPRERAAHKARNPQTGGTIDVPAHAVVHFHATGALRQMVRDADSSRTIYKKNSLRG